MAAESQAVEAAAGPRNPQELVNEIKTVLWGSDIKRDVFHRWAQGFYFSPDESTALVQAEGGPCAVIAPVQAFILKQLLDECDISTWSSLRPEKCYQLLVKAMTEIISQAADPTNVKYSIFLVDKTNKLNNGEVPDSDTEVQTSAATASVECADALRESAVDPDDFHSRLRLHTLSSIEKMNQFFTENIDVFKQQFGVLLLLYSVISTKGIPQMRLEICDPNTKQDPLIHSTFGHGSQTLINLMLSGRAVTNVWDHERNVGGLRMTGIEKQTAVGFLTLLETMRFVEVGSFLKSPANPVWVLGSETHLTVLFSNEKKLASPETPAEKAKRIFRKYDEGNNFFIPTDSLQNLLAELDLYSHTDYVELIKRKLDHDGTGIICLHPFMQEFFPEEPRTYPDTFVLYHYNGLPRSNPNNQVKYHRGQAILLESNVESILDSNSMLTVLQTKWLNIEIQWDNNQNPSIN